MKISNKLFLTILKEKLGKIQENLEKVDDRLCFNTPKLKGFNTHELEDKYPEVYNNMDKGWKLVRKTSLMLNKLLEGIN